MTSLVVYASQASAVLHWSELPNHAIHNAFPRFNKSQVDYILRESLLLHTIWTYWKVIWTMSVQSTRLRGMDQLGHHHVLPIDPSQMFLWVHVKSMIYARFIAFIGELENKVRTEVWNTGKGSLSNSWDSRNLPFSFMRQVKGGHIESR